MVKVGLFHTGGFTEIGALQGFLERACPGARFERRFPARRGPRPTGTPQAPRLEHEGVTGRDLVSRMCDDLRLYDTAAEYAAYVLVDDADCRFCEGGPVELARRKGDWNARVAAALGRPAPLFVMLACQEIEAWLLADWESTFGAEYPRTSVALRRALTGAIGRGALEHPESTGCPQKPDGRGCTVKISAEIERMSAQVEPVDGRPFTYSKAVHGQPMLRRADPEVVAQRCGQFRRDLAALREGVAALGAGRLPDALALARGESVTPV